MRGVPSTRRLRFVTAVTEGIELLEVFCGFATERLFIHRNVLFRHVSLYPEK